LTLNPSSKFASAALDIIPWRTYTRFRSDVKRDLQVSRDVRSAAKHCVSTFELVFALGKLGSNTSVRIIFDTRGSSSNAAACGWSAIER